MHDYQLLKELFPPESKAIDLLNCYQILVDLGFLGIKTDYVGRLDDVVIPTKKPKKSKSNPNPTLTVEQKKLNKLISGTRIKVEHSNAGIKRLGIVYQVFRNKGLIFNDLVMEVSASLWNFHLDFTKLKCYR